jgi:hypothetical protein
MINAKNELLEELKYNDKTLEDIDYGYIHLEEG